MLRRDLRLLGFSILGLVVRPLGHETISSIPRLNEGQPPPTGGHMATNGTTTRAAIYTRPGHVHGMCGSIA
jgi:hypothetical protein